MDIQREGREKGWWMKCIYKRGSISGWEKAAPKTEVGDKGVQSAKKEGGGEKG